MKKLVLILYLLIITTLVFGQVEAITLDGKMVILNEDGTWNYTENNVKSKLVTGYSCSDLISTEIDKVTGKSYTGSKETLVISDDGGKTGFRIILVKGPYVVLFSIQVVGAGSCIDDDDKMNVLFRDGTRLELGNDGDFNCDAAFTLILGDVYGKQEQLEKFGSAEVETMRIWTSDGYIEKDFNSDQSIKFMKSVECLMN